MVPGLAALTIVVLAVGALWPASMGVLLALAGFAAAASCAAGARRLRSTIRTGWISIAVGEFLNGLGNLALLLEFRGILTPPGWFTHVVFLSASAATVFGVFGLVLNPGTRYLRLIALDLIAATAFAFAVAVIWELGRYTGEPAEHAGTLIGSLIFLGVVLDFVALWLGIVASNSQASGHRTANRLVVLGIVAATLGDTEAVTRIQVPFVVTALMWLASSLLIMCAGRFASRTGDRERTITPISLMKLATGLSGVVLISVLVKPAVIVDFRAMACVVVLVAIARQAMVVWSQGQLGRGIEAASTMDPLTGLANRIHFERNVAERLRTAGSVTVMTLDLDRFKWINDTNGNPLGDQLLIQVAGRLTSETSGGDVVARFGGNAFTVLLRDGLDDESALALAEQIHRAATGAYAVGNGMLEVAISGGIAIGHSGSADGVLRAADLALSAAKSQRRGTLWVHDDDLERRESARLRRVNELRTALQNDELTLAYQPVVELPAGDLVAVEGLLRWYDHHGEPVVPARELFELARTGGFLGDLDSWAIERAIRDAAEWNARGHEVAVNVNVSSQKFSDRRFSGWLVKCLAVHELAADRLVIELTEDTILDTQGPALDSLHSLRELGVRFTIDDFGTGYSNLSYLTRLPLYGIKIDRAFIAEIDKSAEKQSITRAIVRLGHELGLVICAEGVEREEELAYVRELGVEMVQGFLLGRPQQVKDLLEGGPVPA